jgi:hypothetical protein
MYQLGMLLGRWEEPKKVAERLMKKLKKYDPFVFHVSLDKNSVYIHFNALPNGLDHKLRVSTHEERERYGYKWQMRLDGLSGVEEPKRWSRYFDDEDELLKSFCRYYDNIERSGEAQNKVDFDRIRRQYHGLEGPDSELEEGGRADTTEVAPTGL